jgi:hypothetical protein
MSPPAHTPPAAPPPDTAALGIKSQDEKPGVVVQTYNPRPKSLRQEDHKFKTRLGYIVRPCLKKK